ncbi:hypothetical protein, partial [Pseudothermotoga sp.]|nr:hypothetical protein [Pseudothermotoga sp.]MDW8140296.1 hypothetical protein [Pseudothermotoga sp.]
ITIYKPWDSGYAAMYSILPEDKPDFKELPISDTKYKYLGICLKDASPTQFATALTANANYYIDMGAGAIKLSNGSVTFGWPCEDWKKNKVQAK